jgi:hypothetical protein
MCLISPEVFTRKTTIPLVASDMIGNAKNRFRARILLLGMSIAASALLQARGDRQESLMHALRIPQDV